MDELPDHTTIAQMQKITNTLWDDIGKNKGVFEGITEFDAKSLWGAATDSYDDIADSSVRELVKDFRTQYKKQKSKNLTTLLFSDLLGARTPRATYRPRR